MSANSYNRSLDIRQPRLWREAIGELVCHADIITAPSSRFSGTIHSANLGDLNILKIASEQEHAVRGRRHIAKDCNDNIVLVLVRSGKLRVEQFDRELVLVPGVFAVYDLTSPYTYGHEERAEVLAIRIPRLMLGSRVGKVGRFIGQTFSTRSGAGRLTAEFLDCVFDEVANIPDAATISYGVHIVDLVGIMLECGSKKPAIAHSAVKSALLFVYKGSDREYGS